MKRIKIKGSAQINGRDYAHGSTAIVDDAQYEYLSNAGAVAQVLAEVPMLAVAHNPAVAAPEEPQVDVETDDDHQADTPRSRMPRPFRK